MRRRNVSNIIERFRTKHALQEERERKNSPASPNGEFISGAHDKNGAREKGIFENEQVRVSTTSVPKGTDWSAPHDGRDRIVILLGQINQLGNKRKRFVLFRLARDSDSGRQRHQRAERFRSDKGFDNSGIQRHGC